MKIERDFIHNGVRYEFDFGRCTPDDDFAQVDTAEDASYFGIWTNPFSYKIVSFMEGDVEVKTAVTLEEYCEALRALKKAYGSEERTAKYFGIDTMLRDRLTERFKEIGLNDLLHKSIQD